MILVTVGTHNRGFDRLVRAADNMARLIDEPMIIQYGSGSHIPQFVERAFRFTTGEEMQELTAQARIVVMHAAAGSLIMALLHGTPMVIVPRLSRYHEVRDDHQLQLAHALDEQGRAVAVLEPSAAALLGALDAATALDLRPVGGTHLVEALKGQLAEWESAGDKERTR